MNANVLIVFIIFCSLFQCREIKNANDSNTDEVEIYKTVINYLMKHSGPMFLPDSLIEDSDRLFSEEDSLFFEEELLGFLPDFIREQDSINRYRDEYISQNNLKPLIVISDRTTFSGLNDFSTEVSIIKGSYFPGYSESLYDDIFTKNKNQSKISIDIKTDNFIAVTWPSDTLNIWRKNNGFSAIFDSLYSGYFSFFGFAGSSKVAFNKQKNIAFLFFSFHIAPLNGSGNYFLLEKKGNKWEIIKKRQCYIS